MMLLNNNTVMFKTTDGGLSWAQLSIGYSNNVSMIDANNALVVGSNGEIKRTQDGGATWTQENTGTYNQLYGIKALPSGEAWAVGDWGTVLHLPSSTHFKTDWTGNPYTPMNIYVTAATIDGVDLITGDEIGVFDGDNCVGFAKLKVTIPSGGYVQIIASTDDPTTPEVDGFIAGHNITYKLWDSTNSREITRVTPTYASGDGTFSSLGSAVVSLNGVFTIIQDVDLTSGWNIFSLAATPDDPDMLQLLDPLISSGKLIKVQDEQGHAVEQLPPPIGWINNIGDWAATEGYYMKVNAQSTLSVTGPLVSLPINIPLTNGWNIMGYPIQEEQDALTGLEPLITANQLIKVQDETGNAVEQLPPPIGWINNIGNFKAGEGYNIKVNTNTSLNLDKPIAPINNLATIKDKSKQKNRIVNKIVATHFTPVWSGNPYLAMNIYVTSATLIGGGNLDAGDEIGIFDGSVCVGTYVLTGPIISPSYISMIASTDDPTTTEVDGFIPGHTISYKFWLPSIPLETSNYIEDYSFGSGIFASLGSAVLSFTEVEPVELTSFTANVNGNQVGLHWETATEVNNYGFEIERKGSNSWTKIGFVQGNGNSNSPKSYNFTDKNLIGGPKFEYRLKQIDVDGKFQYSDAVEIEAIPNRFELMQNYPNPFNPRTTIKFSVPTETELKINVYSVLGEKVLTALEGKFEPGFYQTEINADNLPSGIYIYRLESKDYTQTKKMMLLK